MRRTNRTEVFVEIFFFQAEDGIRGTSVTGVQTCALPICENHAIVLRILAAAYAEIGRFVEAKKTAEQALQAAEIQGNSALSSALRDEISLYELRSEERRVGKA